MKFGFIAHPVDTEELDILKVARTIRSFPLQPNRRAGNSGPAEDNSNDLFTFSQIRSLCGATCDGKIKYVPLLPDEILANQVQALDMVIEVGQQLVDWGAEVIGLGGYTAIIGSRGLEAQRRLPVAVTTGNSYTVYTSVEALEHICARLEISLRDETAVIIGFPGSIGMAVARLLARRGVSGIVLVGRRPRSQLEKLIPMVNAPEGVTVEVCNNVAESLSMGRIVLSATSTGQVIDQSRLLPGTIVIDIAHPQDVIGTGPERYDVLLADGGRFSIGPEVSCEGLLGSLLKNNMFGCLGEVALLALEDRRESFSIGRELDIDTVEEIGHLGPKHGFAANVIYSFGKPVPEECWINVKKARFRSSGAKSRLLRGFESALATPKEDIYDRYGAYVNPVISEISRLGDFDRSFIRASGIHLWDEDGTEYYDFIGGYGSVNLGHNHPRVVQAIRRFLDREVPGLLQASPGALTAALAENLATITPQDLEISFFCNSGTEANEGALKLAKIYTGRDKIVYTENSFHGHTIGSLSVTGRDLYQRPFGALLPGCVRVPFGEIEPLDEALATGDVAAFIVEPIQGEGGVFVPPSGYLKRAQELCERHGTLMILDEVQTGFGRTGKMFAADHEGVQPSIITLAKSLGGGILPVGAYVTTREIWQQAYGSYDRFLLHTSTFGGNNLSAAVALTALQVLYEERLAEHAAAVGSYFMDHLQQTLAKYDFVTEVRGQGLMIGIEFHQSLDRGWDGMRKEILAMMPSDIHSLFWMLPRDLRTVIETGLREIDEQLKEFLTSSFCRLISSRMLNDHQVLTLVTLNNPNVMRVQPPLCVSREQVDLFVQALDQVCRDVDAL